MASFSYNRVNKPTFSNQYQSNEDEVDQMNYQDDFQNEEYEEQYNQPSNFFNHRSYQQNQQQQQYSLYNNDQDKGEEHDEEDEEDQEQRQNQNEYFRYNNFDMYVAKNTNNAQHKMPLQVSSQHQNFAQNKQTRSKSPSISQLPEFLKNQAERSSSYVKLNNEQNQTKSQRQMERCQKLYEMGEKKRQDLILKKKENDELKENDTQCTFRPQSFTKKSLYRAQAHSSMNIFERTNLWNEQKKQKIDYIKESDKNKDLEGCTFQPQIKNSKQSHLVNMSIYPHQNGIGLKGVDKFLRRQILARRAKEELEVQKENPFCHVENKTISKNIESIPISNLTKRNKYQDSYQHQNDPQSYGDAVKNLRWQLHNIEF